MIDSALPLSRDISRQLGDVLFSTRMLQEIADRYGLVLGESHGARHDPKKQYGGRADIPFTHEGENGTMIVIGFNAGDGTGDDKTYSEGSLVIPPEFRFDINSSRVHPRKKTIPIEGMIPLGILDTKRNQLLPHQTDLVELGVCNRTLHTIGRMFRPEVGPKILLTVNGDDNTREGDPHAIFAPKHTVGDIQIAAFIAASNTNSAIANLLGKNGIQLGEW